MTRGRARDESSCDAVSWRESASPQLQQLITDASAPGHADELSGLAASLTAFSTHPPSRRRTRMTPLLGKLAAAKALAVLLGATAATGVTLAASAGTLPAPLQKVAHDVAGAPVSSTTTHGRSQAAHDKNAAKAAAKTTEKQDEATEKADPKGSPEPHPNLVGLCHAYPHVSTNPGKALQNPAFTALITAAGGKAKVEAFCAKTLAASPSGRPTQAQAPHTPKAPGASNGKHKGSSTANSKH